jgi:manganese/zinc/iron transport system permease protein
VILLGDHTLQVVALGAAVLGATSGALGSFAVLRRQSLLGDALSHAALPGIALAFLITGSKAPLVIMLGAGLVGWFGTVLVRQVVKRSRIPLDAALGMLLSVFFGFGLVLLTLIQRRPDASQAGLESYLFGQAAALLERDVVVMAALSAAALVLLLGLWKELKLLAFDPEFGASLGLAMHRVDGILTALLVVAVVIGLQTVGVVLMSAMLVAPAAAARQWTDRLAVMVPLAAVFGVVSGVTGSMLSSVVDRLPTGPTIVVVLSCTVVVSLLFAPRRGLVWRRVRLARARRAPRLDPVLMHLYALSLQHEDNPEHGHSIQVLRTMSPPDVPVQTSLEALAARSLAQRVGDDLWAPTALGLREARRALDGAGDEASP